MSHFYGTVEGQAKTQGTRRGGKNTGIKTHAAGWGGAIRVELYEQDGEDRFIVEMVPWKGKGCRRLLVHGVVGKRVDEVTLRSAAEVEASYSLVGE